MAFATIDVTKGITGTIPVANGGTGVASGTTGQFLKFTGSTTLASAAGGGITEADIWRQNTSTTLSGGNAFLTSNWERADTDSYAKIGTGLSESSGVFSFASTGIYFLSMQFTYRADASDQTYCGGSIQITTDNSSYDIACESYNAIYNGMSGSSEYGSVFMHCLFDVTNTSTHKFKIRAEVASSDVILTGNTGANATSLFALRIGDT